MKPFSFEMFVRDSDDVCQVAVMIAKRLLGWDRSDQFSDEMLRIIGEVREPLEERLTPDDNGGRPTLKELRLQYEAKLEEKKDEIEQFGELEEYDEKELNRVIAKTKLYVSIIEEINLKAKLTLKRSLSLCLILLKQCRANVHDSNLVDICETLINPALQATEDTENQLLVIESIGLLSLLDKDLFSNYSRIFLSILQDSLDQTDFDLNDEEDKMKLKQTIIALKSSIDGLIFYGTNENTEPL